jgi:hypothetical protein
MHSFTDTRFLPAGPGAGREELDICLIILFIRPVDGVKMPFRPYFPLTNLN